jgi:hypothetical protein
MLLLLQIFVVLGVLVACGVLVYVAQGLPIAAAGKIAIQAVLVVGLCLWILGAVGVVPAPALRVH